MTEHHEDAAVLIEIRGIYDGWSVKHSNESARFKKAVQEALDHLGMGWWWYE